MGDSLGMAGCMLLVSPSIGKNHLHKEEIKIDPVSESLLLLVLGTLLSLHSFFHPNHIVVKNVPESKYHKCKATILLS